jgi:hypothetical protein
MLDKKYENKSADKIDEIKAELYSRKTGEIKLERRKLKKERIKFQNTWGEKRQENKNVEANEDLYRFEKSGPSIFSIFFVIALMFFIISVSFASFSLFFQKNEVKNEIDMSIVGPNSIDSGKILNFVVSLENRTKLDYKEIEFIVSYPDSTVDSREKNFIKHESIRHKGGLLAGGELEKNFSAILSGTKDEKKEIEVSVSYKAGNFSNILFLSKVYDIKIDSSPVTIEVNYPKEVLSKKNFTFTIDVLSNSSETLRDLIVVGKYPLGFVVSKTDPVAVFSSNGQGIFKVDQLKPGEKTKIEVSGYLVGQNDEDKFFKFTLGDSVPFRDELRTLFSESEEVVFIKKPDIDLAIFSKMDNSSGDVVAFAGSVVDFNIALSNNLSSLMSDLMITASFSDELIEKKYVDVSKGFYNSNEDKIVWDKNSDSFLESIARNSSVEESFSLKLRDLESITGYFKDPQVVIDFEVTGTNFDNDDSDGYLKENFQKKIKIPTEVILETDIYYENGPFKNIGSTEPKVGEPTTYTVAWKIYNSSSDIFNVDVSAKLPPYIKYINNVSPENSYISYNEDNREVSLKFNKIDAFIGYRTDPKTVYFQVEFVPTSPQIGSTPVVMGQKVLKAKDKFMDRYIEVVAKPKNTSLRSDYLGAPGVGVVRE